MSRGRTSNRRVYLRTLTLAEGVGVVCPLETFPLPSPDDADVGWNWLSQSIVPELVLIWRVSNNFTPSDDPSVGVHVFLRSTFSYRRVDRPGPSPREPTPEEVDLLESLLRGVPTRKEVRWICLELEDPPRRET